MAHTLCLDGLLSQQLVASLELAEELVVQVVSVGQDDERGIIHRRMENDLTGEEEHRKTLARPLGVPDDAASPVAVMTGRLDRRFDGPLDSVELVISGQDFIDLVTVGVVLEDDEVLEQPK